MSSTVVDHATTSAQRAAPFLAAARSLAPEFEAGGREAELQRRLPESVSDQLKSAGLFWLKSPQSLGGAELDPLDFADVMEEIAYHDASAAWATMIGNGVTGVMSGWLPDEGVAELWADASERPIVAGQFTPSGVATPVAGGYRITGRWGFGSGIDHSNWVVGAAIVEGKGEVIFFVVPKSEATVLGNWNVAALQGTGSHGYTVTDVLVPKHRTMAAYTATAQRGGPLFREPISIFISNEISPLVIGVAKRALDDIVDHAASTSRSLTGVGGLIDRVPFQKAVGQSLAKWHAARSLYRDAAAESFGIVEAGGVIDDDLVADLWARHTYVAELADELVREVFRYGGGRVLALDNTLQRHVRNLVGALQHIHLSEEKFEFAGAAYIRGRTGHGTGGSGAVAG
jgi:alkylation response protein AidB-like acyl-CoA dehydrogenase